MPPYFQIRSSATEWEGTSKARGEFLLAVGGFLDQYELKTSVGPVLNP